MTVWEDDLRLLVSPALASQARSLSLDMRDFLLWRSLKVEAEPLSDHFHSPACRH